MGRLVILPCHSIWTPGPTLGTDASEWSLASFQVEGQDHLCFKDHLVQSIQYLQKDPEAYLVISGGQTKLPMGPKSEAYSYYQLAEQLLKQDNREELLSRIATEEFARDSFENVIFSLCRHYELFKKYPTHLTIVGFEFKRERFLKHHLERALLFPRDNVEYIGNAPTPPGSDTEAYFKDLEHSEHKHAVSLFETDWYGIQAPLINKKLSRNPFKRHHGYASSNPKLAEFLFLIRDGSKVDSNQRIIGTLEGLPWVKEKSQK